MNSNLMNVKLSRQEIYDLVWSKPLMHAAKELGLTGVKLGNICTQLQIPKPPRGYWVNLRSGKNKDKYSRPALPLSVTFAKTFNLMVLNEYEQREANRTDKFNPEDLDDPVRNPPENPSESIAQFERRMREYLFDVSEPSSITQLHPLCAKVLAADRLFEADRKLRYFGDEPQYSGKKGDEKLKLLNAFLQSFFKLGFELSTSGKKHIKFYVKMFGSHRQFAVFIRKHEDHPIVHRRGIRPPPRIGYGFSWDPEHYNGYGFGRDKTVYYEFEVLTADSIKRIVMDVLVKKEQSYRQNLIDSYEHRLQSRQKAIDARDRKIAVEAELRRKAREELLAKRKDLMMQAVDDMNFADQVRSLIDIFQKKSASRGRSIEGFDRWVRWANHYANTTDPRNLSIDSFEAWVRKFKLKH